MSKRIAIIGGGLAGTACAYVLKNAGYTPIIYEASNTLANGASGNDLGLYNPRISAFLEPHGQYYKDAFEIALETFEALSQDFDLDWNPCGALHFITDAKKDIRYNKAVQNWGWSPDDMRIVAAAEASSIAGITLSHDALYLRRSGYISPRKLCNAYINDVQVHLNHTIEHLDDLEEEIIVLACGMGVLNFPCATHLPLRPVRGQVTTVRENKISRKLKTALCYGGYTLPAHNDMHMIGATFQRGKDSIEREPEDNAYNIDKLLQYCPDLKFEHTAIRRSRAGVRTTSRYHTPIAEHLDNNVYVSTAHGSHGILSSLKAAHVIKDIL